MANTLVFQANFGDRTIALIRHTGPTSYTAISVASPPTGGDSVPASAFGLARLESVIGGLDDTGAYHAVATLAGKQEATAAQLMWKTAVTGAEVSGATNLSAKSVFLIGIGY